MNKNTNRATKTMRIKPRKRNMMTMRNMMTIKTRTPKVTLPKRTTSTLTKSRSRKQVNSAYKIIIITINLSRRTLTKMEKNTTRAPT